MTREAILSEIRSLEEQKQFSPEQVTAINEQITHLCDQLRSLRKFAPRKGIL